MEIQLLDIVNFEKNLTDLLLWDLKDCYNEEKQNIEMISTEPEFNTRQSLSRIILEQQYFQVKALDSVKSKKKEKEVIYKVFTHGEVQNLLQTSPFYSDFDMDFRLKISSKLNLNRLRGLL
jgi:hypothetical protein